MIRTSPPVAFTERRSVRLPGTRSMSPKEVKDDILARGDFQGLVDQLQGRDTHRASGAVDQVEALGQELINAEFDDGVGLAAAYLHQASRDGS